MSRRQQQLNSLRQIKALRQIGSEVAEQEALCRKVAFEQAEQAVAAKVQSVDLTLAGWRASVNSADFDPAALGIWGTAMLRETEELRGSDARKSACLLELEAARHVLSEAQSFESCAGDMLKKAIRSAARACERTADEEREDRVTISFFAQ